MGASVFAMTSMASTSMAQDSETVADTVENEDVVVVTGFRESLARAQDIKYDADTFVDAITAEDIGALPDRSVAEALQRIPGVNIGRFAQADDPDRFSVEGSGVVVRGLPFVRSELNGREIFSANGGRALSFNDVSPELIGGVEVFKNTTADMIDGGISGTVNLITRKPLDRPGFQFGGTIEANYGDLAEEVSPGFSALGSNTWETGAGTFGLQLGYAQSELISRTDASQVTDPCYRANTLDGGCFRIDGIAFAGGSGFDESNFPPAGSVVVPKGAGVRTTTFDRDRKAYSAVGQWESNDGKLLATAEYLRAESDQTLDEFSILALVNDDALFPVEADGQSWTFDDDGIFESGVLTQGAGIPTENLRFQREDDAKTEDFSVDLKWSPTDRLALNFEAQHIKSDRNEDGFIAAMRTQSDIFLDLGGDTPDVQFLPVGDSTTNQFEDAGQNFYWFALDNQVRNTGELTSFRADVDYDLEDKFGVIKGLRFGARWADRNRVTKGTNFNTWGALSIPWSFNGGAGGAVFANNETGDIASYSNLRSPFEGFQRGNAEVPVPGGSAFFFGGDNLVQEYLSGATTAAADEIYNETVRLSGWNNDWGRIGEAWNPMDRRFNGVDANGDPVPLIDGRYLDSEVSDVDEQTTAFYGRVDFGTDNFFSAGKLLEGNIGVRYVETTINSEGVVAFPGDAPDLTRSCDPALTLPGVPLPGYCFLSALRQAEFFSVFNGGDFDNSSDIKFNHWLPSFNVKLNTSDDFLLRLGISKGISRPDLASFRMSGTIADNTGNLRQGGTLETGPLFRLDTGNRDLKPVESWNYDVSAEWYFDDVGSFTASAFRKEITGLIGYDLSTVELTSDDGVSAETEIGGPANTADSSLYGFEFAYQQTYDFLPGLLSGLGAQATYTYVNGDDLRNAAVAPGARSQLGDDFGQVGISKDTINLVGFYEKDKISARLAYNWRSDFAITPRDVIFPFSPIIGESTGQLDGSFFYSVTDQLKVGVQGVNLLDEVTQTSQVIDFDGTKVSRSAFRNDRRYTFLARFEF